MGRNPIEEIRALQDPQKRAEVEAEIARMQNSLPGKVGRTAEKLGRKLDLSAQRLGLKEKPIDTQAVIQEIKRLK